MGKNCRAARAWHSITISTPLPRPLQLYRYFAHHPHTPPTTTKKGKTCNFLSLFFVYILFSFNIDKAPTEKKSEVGGVVLKKEQQRKMVKFSLT